MFRTLDRRSVVAAFFLAASIMVAIIAMEVSAGGRPSWLVWQQQAAYYIGIPALALLVLLREGLSRAVWALIAVVAMGIFTWGGLAAGRHTGIVLELWGDTTICASDGRGVDLSLLGQVSDGSTPACGMGTMSILGMPLPVINLVVSIWIVGLIAGALVRRVTGGLPVVQ